MTFKDFWYEAPFPVKFALAWLAVAALATIPFAFLVSPIPLFVLLGVITFGSVVTLCAYFGP